jgi:hypothetical protein
MPKDAKGHGSNPTGQSLAAISARRKVEFGQHGGFRAPIKTDAVHREHPKAAPVKTHDAMGGVGPNDPRAGSRDFDAFGRPRADKSSYDEYSRDLSLRSRNGGIGSGGRY